MGVPPRCPDCDPASHVRVAVQGRMHLADRARFPGAQLWDLALHAAVLVAPGERPQKDWEYRDNHGDLHTWDERVGDYPHEDLHVAPRAGSGGRPTMDDDIKRMDIAEFREFGYLQELNRGFLHPLGLALEVVVDEDGTERLGGVWDYRDDPEGMRYEGIDLATKAKRVALERERRRPAREAALGYWQQPVEAAWSCPRCGSSRWVSTSLDGGATRIPQCVPCGHYDTAQRA